MIDTTVLHPPCTGPLSNPLLFGIAEGLAALLPPIERTAQGTEAASGRDGGGAAEHDATAQAA